MEQREAMVDRTSTQGGSDMHGQTDMKTLTRRCGSHGDRLSVTDTRMRALSWESNATGVASEY